jgi:hypothetical protein
MVQYKVTLTRFNRRAALRAGAGFGMAALASGFPEAVLAFAPAG